MRQQRRGENCLSGAKVRAGSKYEQGWNTEAVKWAAGARIIQGREQTERTGSIQQGTSLN